LAADGETNGFGPVVKCVGGENAEPTCEVKGLWAEAGVVGSSGSRPAALDLPALAPHACRVTDEEHLLRFEDGSLPLELWAHRAHSKVGYTYLRRHSFDEALRRLRAGIRAYNAAQGIADTPTGGYHETMTQAWLHSIHTTLCQFGPAESADAFFDAQSQLTQKRALLLFYSRDHIMSAAAKASFVPPDLAPLPIPLHPKENGLVE